MEKPATEIWGLNIRTESELVTETLGPPTLIWPFEVRALNDPLKRESW